VERNLLREFADGRRTAESAAAHFAAADDATGEARASVLRALNEFGVASAMGPEVLRKEQRALLDTAVLRLQRAQVFFEANELHTDAIAALYASGSREQVLGEFERAAPVYRAVGERARARGDKLFEVRATQNLAFIAGRQGSMAQSAAMLLPGLRNLLGVGPIDVLDAVVLIAGGVLPFFVNAAHKTEQAQKTTLHFRSVKPGSAPPPHAAEGRMGVERPDLTRLLERATAASPIAATVSACDTTVARALARRLQGSIP